MKLTKRIFALALALCLILCLSISAFADEGEETTPEEEPTQTTTTVTANIGKIYKIAYEGTVAPGATFTLEPVENGKSVKDSEATEVPDLEKIDSVTYTEGEATAEGVRKNIVVTLPEYTSVGVYEYTLKETAGNIAGIVYYPKTIKLVVTVQNDDATGKPIVTAVHAEDAELNPKDEGQTKKDNFPNTYYAGKLVVSKTVKGNLGDKNKEFDFSVEFTAPTGGKTVASTIKFGNEDLHFDENGKLTKTFKLANGSTATFENLPWGVKYTITEDDYSKDGYKTTVGETETTKAEGTIEAEETNVGFTNTKTGDVDTGISLDSLPYILALAVALGGAVVLFTRKRHIEE